MTKKKFGKILLLSGIPHFIIWTVCAGIFELPDHTLPHFMLWWILGIMFICIPAGYLIEGVTPKDTWKTIIKYINE